jgi:hypothetical protein
MAALNTRGILTWAVPATAGAVPLAGAADTWLNRAPTAGFTEALRSSDEVRDYGTASGLKFLVVGGAAEVTAATGERQLRPDPGEGRGSSRPHSMQACHDIVGCCVILLPGAQ